MQVAAMAAKALAQLDRIPVKGSAPKTGYHRSVFGRAWSDDVTVDKGHNGCKTRDDVLQRDLTDVVMQGQMSGHERWLDDPYTGSGCASSAASTSTGSRSIMSSHWVTRGGPVRSSGHRRSASTSQTTCATCKPPRRVGQPTEEASNAASWLPPNRSYRCTYVARQVKVKAAYGLWVVPAERDAMRRVLAKVRALTRLSWQEGTCPSSKLGQL